MTTRSAGKLGDKSQDDLLVVSIDTVVVFQSNSNSTIFRMQVFCASSSYKRDAIMRLLQHLYGVRVLIAYSIALFEHA